MAQIMRDYQPTDFGSAGNAPLPSASAPLVSPNYAKYAGSEGRVKVSAPTPQPSVSDQLITSLLPVAGQWANTQIKQGELDSYLKGQAAAASGVAKDAIDSNILTKDWASAGWQDTKGRLALADAVAQTSIDIKQKLREKDPQAMQDYLQQRRDQLLPLMDGMSMEAKKGFMAQMLTADRSAITEHAAAYSKFAIDTQAQAVTTSFSVQNDAMNAAKNDPARYEAATASAAANIYSNVWMNPNMPTDTKRKLIGQAAQLALENGNIPFYEKLRNNKLPGADVTMIESLPFEQQQKLSQAYVKAQGAASVMSNSDYLSKLGIYDARLHSPNAAPVTWAEHQALMQEGVQRNVITAPMLEKYAKDWATAQYKIQDDTRAAAYFQNGNYDGLMSLGKSEDEGAKAYLHIQTINGVSAAQATLNLANVGLTTGSSAAFRAVGTLMKSSVGQLRLGNDKMDASQVAGLNSIMQIIDASEAKGNVSARTAFLSSFSPDDAALLMDFRSKLRQTNNVQVAAADAAQDELTNKAMTPQDRAALGAQNASKNLDIINDLTPKGVFAQAWGGLVPTMFRTSNSLNTDTLRADRGSFSSSGGIGTAWREDPERVNAAMAQAKVRVLEELHALDAERPYMDAEDKKSLALANVARNTVTTAGGPVIVPRGLTPQQFFGTPANVNADTIGAALNTLHEPAKGNRLVYSVTPAGQMRWEEWGPRDPGNPNPSIVGSGVFDPKLVGPAVQAQIDRKVEEFNMRSGSGTTIKGGDGSAVTFNGNNTIGIADNVAYNIRQDLVKYEGVRMKPYNGPTTKMVNGQAVAGSGIDTVGVGVSKTSPYYPPIEADGTVLPSNINKSFMLASNDAMDKANTATQQLPEQYRNVNTMRLFTQLAYQHSSVYPEVVKAMASGDRAAALSALTATTAYKGAHAERRTFYTNLLDRIMYNNPQ